VTKIAVVLLGVLCLLVAGASYGVIQALTRVGADLHRSAIALDALAMRMGAVEEDLASLSENVYAIAESVDLLAESLVVEEEEGEGEAVGLRSRRPSGDWRDGREPRIARRPCAMLRDASHRVASSATPTSLARRRDLRVKSPCVRSRSAAGRSGSSPG
jgi:hypothetical protein